MLNLSNLDPPSGLWNGYFRRSYSTVRHKQTLKLYFNESELIGTGSDDIGRFFIRGSFLDNEANYIKEYDIGGCMVKYVGFWLRSSFSGMWFIHASCKGFFRLWPCGVWGRQDGGKVKIMPLHKREICYSLAS